MLAPKGFQIKGGKRWNYVTRTLLPRIYLPFGESLTELPTPKALVRGGRWTHPVFFCKVETFKQGIPKDSGSITRQ